ncbi:DUF6153 family protein [Streptomyces sp. R41]|uniref:DUF6153 family protein n=1 Tax=Streptomyces sp. R41 TaxID=3238632 RepID=A0AB39RCJ3_9ACTN
MVTRSRAREVLLFAALLLGIVTMHTLGHPSGHGSDRSSGYSSHEGSGHSSYAMAQAMSSTPGHAQEHTTGASMNADMPPMNGMDPLSVCLAVLGGATLVLLLAAALGTPCASGATPPTRARLLQALWPNPPPQITLLSRLSVLRI